MFHASFGSDSEGPFSVAIHGPDQDSPIAVLVICDSRYQSEFNIYRNGDNSIAEFMAIGLAIVEQCEKLMPDAADASDALLASTPAIMLAPYTGEPIDPTIREINGEIVIDVTGVAPQQDLRYTTEDDNPF